MSKDEETNAAMEAVRGLAAGLRITAKGIVTEAIAPILVELDRWTAQGKHSPPYQAGIEKVRDILKEEQHARQGPDEDRDGAFPNSTPLEG
jgi:hypothetical protein